MEQIVQIPTEKLLPNPYQPRKQFKSEDMLSLADSIKENGVLQPLLCRQINQIFKAFPALWLNVSTRTVRFIQL